ncbi:MAG: J domain-containing protein [Gammaproteobacteria bacterium]|nr:J domain-containing protein [Gammaproteobacteria bacterium]MCW8922399.1 J domain-containing protein [Gammaproteobacteria bacterium]
MDFSAFIFLSVMMVAFGYIAGNSKNFNFAKMALLGLFLIPFITEFNYGKAQLLTMLVAFIIGYLLPYAHILEGLGDSISDAINALRYRDAYEDIRRKEAEVEEMRRQYEQTQREGNRQKQEQAQQRRQEQSQDYREKQQRKKKSEQTNNKHQSTYQDSTMGRYHMILGLDPDKKYSFDDIKKAYRRKASKYHPDKYHGKSSWGEMNEKFKEISAAYQWLAING